MNKFLSDFGTWYLIGLGTLAIVVTMFFLKVCGVMYRDGSGCSFSPWAGVLCSMIQGPWFCPRARNQRIPGTQRTEKSAMNDPQNRIAKE